MKNIKVLDCTLRDGGYVNDWNFGFDNARKIVSFLDKSKLDYIEIGYLDTKNSIKDKTLFSSFQEINDFLKNDLISENLVVMITYSSFPIKMVPFVEDSKIKSIRLIFKKHQINDALDYALALKNKGYSIFINPMYISQYSNDELLFLIEKVNELNPSVFTMVDSLGVLNESDLLSLYYLVDNNLNKEITLGFHSHNNLQLSFSNAKVLMQICKHRDLVIDSTVFGIGRGAGNIHTELLTKFLNDNYNSKYNLLPILEIVQKYINPIFEISPWGYSVPYYLAAINHCHPNYAKYLIDKGIDSVDVIDNILRNIPEDKKTNYDISVIDKLF